MRAARLFPHSMLIRSLLCFAVVMQMLGAPISLWALDFDGDLFDSSLLEGLSLPPQPVTVSPTIETSEYVESSLRALFVLLAESLFHPPYDPSSPIFHV